ncbi:MAG TPA: tetratricopeptide repeat protein, partial [Bacteroidia bacterium]|nr:tetratricopeptide repeat protein [Bacteroidia bacterium]
EIPDAVKYIKYCYLLLAKAKLYKNEYLQALDAVDYASKEYRKTDVKYEALMWEARADNQIGAVSKSEEIIDLLKSSSQLPKKLNARVYATIADYYSRTGEYEEMQKALVKAIAAERKKPVKSRYYFILAQLAQRSGDLHKAFDLYSTVLKMHPTYDLDFEAHINRALLFKGDAKANENIKKELLKMLKPTKNLDNRDQIYYALAEISEKERDTVQAIKYFNKSIRSSTTNTLQKSISYLALADYNFAKPEYVRAKKYYDSTLATLPKSYKGRDSILAKKQNLERLVKCLEIISQGDSLLRLSKMSKKDLDKYVDDMIAKAKEAEEDKKKKAAEEANQPTSNPLNNGNAATAGTSNSWYFYNSGQMQMGLNEFLQKWGNRPLEDNWRRSKKPAETQQSSSQSEATKRNGNDSAKGKTSGKKDSLNDVYSRAYYMKHIPSSDDKVKALNDSLVEAYYSAGCIYKEYLHNNAKAVGEFEELLSRYPENKYKLTTYYQLYRIYEEMGNTERMNYYKNILLTKYANTEYALLITNPEKYKANLKASKEEILRLYTATLHSYESEKFMEVLNGCQQADSLYPKNPLSPKFAFLEAVAIGYTQGLDAYKNALTKVILLYPKDSIKDLAQRTLSYLNKKPVPPPIKDTNIIKYSIDKDSSYYCIIVIDNKEASKVNDLRNSLSNSNAQSYGQDNLKMDNLMLNGDHQMVLVRSFKTIERAKDYYGFVSGSTALFKLFTPDSYQIFYISDKNFHILLKHQKADEYALFFKDKLK